MSDTTEPADDGLPDAHWGTADTPLPDWREFDDPDDTDDDDELLAETPEDVIAALGFDPLDEDDSEDDEQPPPERPTRADRAGYVRIDAREDVGAMRAAGLLIVFNAEDGDRVLFVRHAERGTWEFPGGEVEPGESAEDAALREVSEEIGGVPVGNVSLLMRTTLTGVDYSTFMARASTQFAPTLADGELSDWQWSPATAPPEPIHPGARLALARLSMNELDLARAIASGEIDSPQQYENLWLFALRITGTGASYRDELDEYVWRDPALYLNDEFMARCNGLPVVFDHPDTDELTQAEFEKRIIGAIMLPYLDGDEVWGVARIYDQDAALLMRSEQMSTSPAVIFRDPGVNQTRRLESGRTLLIEGVPSLLDHIAICSLGVWDKGGAPTGVALPNKD